MKKLLFLFTFSIFAQFLACTDSQAPQGPAGPQGVTGPTGATGPQGPAAATARYYDYTLTWTGTQPSPSKDFQIPNFKPGSEYPITYVLSSPLFHQLPLNGLVVLETDGITGNEVNMNVTYTDLGFVFITDVNYHQNGPSSYKFRTVVAPMIAGGRLPANIPYETLKKLYNLPD